MQETLELAPVIIHGTNTANHQSDNYNNRDQFNSEFDVISVFRSPDPIGDTLIVTMGSVRHTCQGTKLFEVGTEYILALEPDTQINCTYMLAEPGAKTTAAFAPTPDQLTIASDIGKLPVVQRTTPTSTSESNQTGLSYILSVFFVSLVILC